MNDQLLIALLENPTLPGHLVFRSLSSIVEVQEVITCFEGIRGEREKSINAAQIGTPTLENHFHGQCAKTIANLSACLDCERHFVKGILQDIEKSQDLRALRRDELVDVWGRLEGARALLRALFISAVGSEQPQEFLSSKWESLFLTERRCAEELLGYLTLNRGPEWVEPVSRFLVGTRDSLRVGEAYR